MKRLKLLAFTFFAALLLLMAMGKSDLVGHEWFDMPAWAMAREVEDILEEGQETPSYKTSLQVEIESEKKSDDDNAKLLKKEPAAENISFNFIYYILYKFKYIDIFDLLRPSK